MLSYFNPINYFPTVDNVNTYNEPTRQTTQVIEIQKEIYDTGNFNASLIRPDPIETIKAVPLHKQPLSATTKRSDPIKVVPIVDNTMFSPTDGYQDKSIKQQPNIINNYFSTPNRTIDQELHNKVQNLNNSIAQGQFNINQKINDVNTRQDKITDHIITSNNKINSSLDAINASISTHAVNVKANQTNIAELQKQHTEAVNKANIQNQTTLNKINEVQQSNQTQIKQTQDKITELRNENDNNIRKLQNEIIQNRKAPIVKTIGSNDIFVPINAGQNNNNNFGLVIPIVIAFGVYAMTQ